MQEMQRYGRNKATLINNAYINSGEYRKKFDRISENKKLNRYVYQIAKSMLFHRSGSALEDMYWIDIDSILCIARETTQQEKEKIVYSQSTKRALLKNKKKNILAIHTHPNSMPPSINDFNSFFENKYTIGMICCHDGKVFLYESRRYIPERHYKIRIAKLLKNGYNIYDAQSQVIDHYIAQGDISCKEV